jgi:hypothetical protein
MRNALVSKSKRGSEDIFDMGAVCSISTIPGMWLYIVVIFTDVIKK